MPSLKRKGANNLYHHFLYVDNNDDAAFRIKRMRTRHEDGSNLTLPEESHKIQIASRNENVKLVFSKPRRRKSWNMNWNQSSEKCFTLYDCRGSLWTVTTADQYSKCNLQNNSIYSSSDRSVLFHSDCSDFNVDNAIWKKSLKSNCRAVNNIPHNVKKLPKENRIICSETEVDTVEDTNWKSEMKSHLSHNYTEFKSVMHICQTGENTVLFQVGKQLSEKKHSKKEAIFSSELYNVVENGSKERKQKEMQQSASDNDDAEIRDGFKTKKKSFKNMKAHKMITCDLIEECLSSKSNNFLKKKKESKKKTKVKKPKKIYVKSKKERQEDNEDKRDDEKENDINTDVMEHGENTHGKKPASEVMKKHIDQQKGENLNKISNTEVMRKKIKKSKKRLKAIETEEGYENNKGECNRDNIGKREVKQMRGKTVGEEIHLRVKRSEKDERRCVSESEEGEDEDGAHSNRTEGTNEIFEVQKDVNVDDRMIEDETTGMKSLEKQMNITEKNDKKIVKEDEEMTKLENAENIGRSRSTVAINDEDEEDVVRIIKKRVTRKIIESDEEDEGCIMKNLAGNEVNLDRDKQESCYSNDDDDDDDYDYEDSFIDDGSVVSDNFIDDERSSLDDDKEEEGEKEDDSEDNDLGDTLAGNKWSRMAMQFFDDEAEEGEETEDEHDLEEEEEDTENEEEEDCKDSEDSDITGVEQFIDGEAVEDVPVVRRKKKMLVIDSEEEEGKKKVDLENLEKTVHIMKKLSRMMTVGELESAAIKKREKKNNEDAVNQTEEREVDFNTSLDVNAKYENMDHVIKGIGARLIKTLKKKQNNTRVVERNYVSDTECTKLKKPGKEGI